MNSKRNVDESFEDYKARQRAEYYQLKEKLKGTVIWNSVFYEAVPDKEGNPKLDKSGKPIMQRFAHTYRKENSEK